MSKINDALKRAEKTNQANRDTTSEKLKNILNILEDPTDLKADQPDLFSSDAAVPPNREQIGAGVSLKLQNHLDQLQTRIGAIQSKETRFADSQTLLKKGKDYADRGLYEEALECWKKMTQSLDHDVQLSKWIEEIQQLYEKVRQAQKQLKELDSKQGADLVLPSDCEKTLVGQIGQLAFELEGLKRREGVITSENADRQAAVEMTFQKAKFFLERKQTASAIEQFERIAEYFDAQSSVTQQVESLRKNYRDLSDAMRAVKKIREVVPSNPVFSQQQQHLIEDLSAQTERDVQSLRLAVEEYRRQKKHAKRPHGWMASVVLLGMVCAGGVMLIKSSETQYLTQRRQWEQKTQGQADRIGGLIAERDGLQTKFVEFKRRSETQMTALQRKLDQLRFDYSQAMANYQKRQADYDTYIRKLSRRLEVLKEDNLAKERLIAGLITPQSAKSESEPSS